MIRIAGVPITNGEAEWIADQLLKSGTLGAAASALHQITATLESRHVIVDALEDPPNSLAELRSVLLHEQRVREGIS